VRQGVGDFDRQTFLANIESIRKATFSEGNIKSTFRRCGFVPFRPYQVLQLIRVSDEVLIEDNQQQRDEILSSDTDDGLWSTPKTHREFQRQGMAVQEFLRSSIEPPDTPTREQNRANLKKFVEIAIAKDILHDRLTDYMWNSHLAQNQ